MVWRIRTTITMRWQPTKPRGIIELNDAAPESPDILLEHGAVIVLNKPCGLLTQSPPGIDSLELRLKKFVKHRDKKLGKVYLVPVHRLDRPVSGGIVFVKNVRAAKRLSKQFQDRTVKKTYIAIVSGIVEPESNRWVDFMRKIPDEAKSEIVLANHKDAKEAILGYKTLAFGKDKTLLEIELETGRTHQIRLQCASHGHPILGDELYGSTQPFGAQSVDLRSRQIALHARRIEFYHPMQDEQVKVCAPFPEIWEDSEFVEAANLS